MAEYELAGNVMETPLINAAGSINGTSEARIVQEVDTLAHTAIGAITVGSFTVPEQAGNELNASAWVYFHDPDTGATYNSMGLPNIGLRAAARLLPEIIARAHEHGKPVIVSVAPTLATPEIGDAVEQTVRLIGELQETAADLLEFNASCPNVLTGSGDRKPVLGHSLENMHRLVERLEPLIGPRPTRLGIKLPPYLFAEDRAIVPALSRLFKAHPMFDFIVTANTVPFTMPGAPDQLPGGLSGSATSEIGRDQLTLWRKAMGNEYEIVSTLGMNGGLEMAARLRLGAVAVGGVTFLWESQDWGKAVTNLISAWVDREAELANL